jgi:hypothetical protein
VFSTFPGNNMGQILAAPVTTKHSTERQDNRIMFGASSMQGWRISKKKKKKKKKKKNNCLL